MSSLTGSVHCVGMCGGLMLNVAKNKKENFYYHTGRLLSYLALGMLAGGAGEAFFSAPLLRSVRLATSIILTLMFFWMALRLWQNRPIHISLLPASLLIKLQTWSLKHKFISPAFLIGLSSGILPCGWLHTFLIAALATQSPAQSALLLFFFWLGTLPAMITASVVAKKLMNPLFDYSSKILAILLLGLGLTNLVLKNFALLAPQDSSPTEGHSTEDSCPYHPPGDKQ